MKTSYWEVKRPTSSIALIFFNFNPLFLHHSRSYEPQPFPSVTSYHVPYLAPTFPPYISFQLTAVTPSPSHDNLPYTRSSPPSWDAKMNSLSSKQSAYTPLIPSGTVGTPIHCLLCPQIHTERILQEIVYSTPFLINCTETSHVVQNFVTLLWST